MDLISQTLDWQHKYYENISKFKCIETVLNEFGIHEYSPFAQTMFDTGAFIAGGALTHALFNETHKTNLPLPETSDLDIWVSEPKMLFVEEKELAPIYCERTYRLLITRRWREYLEKIGYVGPDKPGDDYKDFTGHGDIHMTVYNYKNAALKRSIQLIFTCASASKTVGLFDLSIVRHMMYFNEFESFRIQSTFNALKDIKNMTLSTYIDNEKTKKRISKYVERYGLTLKYSVALMDTGESAK